MFRLARELGKTVTELKSSITSKELTEWMAFFSLEKKEIDKEMLKQKAKAGATRKHKF